MGIRTLCLDFSFDAFILVKVFKNDLSGSFLFIRDRSCQDCASGNCPSSLINRVGAVGLPAKKRVPNGLKNRPRV
jgi:hypothetical protein